MKSQKKPSQPTTPWKLKQTERLAYQQMAKIYADLESAGRTLVQVLFLLEQKSTLKDLESVRLGIGSIRSTLRASTGMLEEVIKFKKQGELEKRKD